MINISTSGDYSPGVVSGDYTQNTFVCNIETNQRTSTTNTGSYGFLNQLLTLGIEECNNEYIREIYFEFIKDSRNDKNKIMEGINRIAYRLIPTENWLVRKKLSSIYSEILAGCEPHIGKEINELLEFASGSDDGKILVAPLLHNRHILSNVSTKTIGNCIISGHPQVAWQCLKEYSNISLLKKKDVMKIILDQCDNHWFLERLIQSYARYCFTNHRDVTLHLICKNFFSDKKIFNNYNLDLIAQWIAHTYGEEFFSYAFGSHKVHDQHGCTLYNETFFYKPFTINSCNPDEFISKLKYNYYNFDDIDNMLAMHFPEGRYGYIQEWLKKSLINSNLTDDCFKYIVGELLKLKHTAIKWSVVRLARDHTIGKKIRLNAYPDLLNDNNIWVLREMVSSIRSSDAITLSNKVLMISKILQKVELLKEQGVSTDEVEKVILSAIVSHQNLFRMFNFSIKQK